MVNGSGLETHSRHNRYTETITVSPYLSRQFTLTLAVITVNFLVVCASVCLYNPRRQCPSRGATLSLNDRHTFATKCGLIMNKSFSVLYMHIYKGHSGSSMYMHTRALLLQKATFKHCSYS